MSDPRGVHYLMIKKQCDFLQSIKSDTLYVYVYTLFKEV